MGLRKWRNGQEIWLGGAKGRKKSTGVGPPSAPSRKWSGVAKMASHAIFQYNVLVIDIDNPTLGLI